MVGSSCCHTVVVYVRSAKGTRLRSVTCLVVGSLGVTPVVQWCNMESRLRLYCAVPILLNVGESLTVDSVNEVPAVIGNARGSDFIACT